MPEYVVISDQIFEGTISDHAYPTRLAWTAILFAAEKLRGRVKLPVRVLANKAKITVAEAARALRELQEPDPYSSSKELDGRRLVAIPGEEDWYQVVTWEKHAAERAAFFNRLRQQRWREKRSKNEDRVTVSNAALRSVTKEPEPEPEPEIEKNPPKPPQRGGGRKRRRGRETEVTNPGAELPAAVPLPTCPDWQAIVAHLRDRSEWLDVAQPIEQTDAVLVVGVPSLQHVDEIRDRHGADIRRAADIVRPSLCIDLRAVRFEETGV